MVCWSWRKRSVVVFIIASFYLFISLVKGSVNQSPNEGRSSWVNNVAIPGLPRYDLSGRKISADMSDYINFRCEGSGKDRSCSFDQSGLQLSLEESEDEDSEKDGLRTYALSVALYAVISFAAGVGVILLTLLYLLGRIGCAMFSLCWSGGEKKKKKKVPSPHALATAWWASAVLSLLLFVSLGVLVVLAYEFGMRDAFGAVSETADVPLGAANIMYRSSLAVQPLLIAAVSSVLLPAMRRANSTLCGAVHWDGILSDLRDLNASVNRLPSLDSIEVNMAHIQNATSEISTHLDGIFAFSDDFLAQKNLIKNTTDVILADLRDLNASLIRITNATDDAYASVVKMDEYELSLFGAGGSKNYSLTDRDGYVDSVEYDLRRTARTDVPGDGIPTSESLNSAATGPSASMTRVLSGDLHGRPTELGQLISKLHLIYQSIVLLPNFEDTGDNLLLINATFNEMLAPQGVANLLPIQIQRIEAAVATVPKPEEVKVHLQDVFDAVNGIDSAPLIELMERANAQIQTIPPNIEEILAAVDRVTAVLDTFRSPVRSLILERTRLINSTIMELPVNTTKLFAQFESALAKASDSADSVGTELQDLNRTIVEETDIPSFITQITAAQEAYEEKLREVNQTELLASLDTAAGFNSTFNTSNYEQAVTDAREVIASVYIPPELVQGLKALEALRFAVEQALRVLVGVVGDVGSGGTVTTRIGDYRLLVQGVCSVGWTRYCLVNSDCSSGGICTRIAEYRCSATGTIPLACVQDSDCTAAGSFCLADATRAATLQAALIGLADPTLTELGQDEVIAQFDEVRAATEKVNIDGMREDLDAFIADLESVNTFTHDQQIKALQVQLFDPTYSLDQYLNDLRSAQERIQEVNFTDYSVQVREAQGDIQAEKDTYRAELAEYMLLLQDTQEYLYANHTLRATLSELELSHLQAIAAARGVGAVLLSVGGSLQSAADEVVELLRNTSANLKPVEFAGELSDPAEMLDRFTANPHRGFYNLYETGSFYFMMQLTNETASMVIEANDSTRNLVATDVSGSSYPDGKYCVTSTCFENQQAEFEDGYGAYLPLLLVPLAIVALIALCNFGCVLVSPKRGGCCRRCMPVWMLCMIIAIVPWYLIFSGFFFAFIIGASDSCTAGPHIAANYVTAFGDDLCVVLGGNGTLTECVVKGNNVSVTANLRRMANAALGIERCDHSEAGDPLTDPLLDLAAQLRNASAQLTQEELAKKQYRKYRAKPKAIATDFTDGSARVVRDFVTDIGSDIITCENVQDVIEYFTSPVCYSVVGPWAWIMGTIYLAAWTMCCLGIPTGCVLKNIFRWEAQALQAVERGAEWFDGAWHGDAASLRRHLLWYHHLAARGKGPLVGRRAARRSITGDNFGDQRGGADEEGTGIGDTVCNEGEGREEVEQGEEKEDEKDEQHKGTFSSVAAQAAELECEGHSVRGEIASSGQEAVGPRADAKDEENDEDADSKLPISSLSIKRPDSADTLLDTWPIDIKLDDEPSREPILL